MSRHLRHIVRRGALTLFAAVIVARAGIYASVAQTRDAGRQVTGTGSIAGTVMTDEATSQPVRRATVTIFISGDQKSYRSTATDDAGRFEFVALPGGAYSLVATKTAFITAYYGAKRAGSTVGVPIALADGQRLGTVAVRMLRGGAITGVITDQSGRPMSSVGVQLQRATTSSNGERVLTAFNPGPYSSSSSDDRGVYRVFGLPPGDYVVSAKPRLGDVLLNQAGVELREPTTEELQWAAGQIQGRGGAPASAASALQKPGKAVAYASVFHPSTTDASAATIVTVSGGQERTAVDLRMQLVTTSRVEGTVTDGDGRLANGVQVTMVSKSAAVSSGGDANLLLEVGLLSGGLSRTGPDGAFSFVGVQPGSYTVMARPSVAGRGGPASTTTGIWAEQDVNVSGQDVSGMALTLMAGLSVGGRVVVEGATVAPDQRVILRLTPAQTTASGAPVSLPMSLAGPDTPFSLSGVVPGRYRLTGTWGAGPSATPWTIKAAMLEGRDVSDVPFDVKGGADMSGLVVTFSSAMAQVSGVLYDSSNRPTSDLSIALFTTDRTLWYSGSRRVRPPARAASNGTFAFTGLPAGEYYLAALTDFEPGDMAKMDFLDQVAAIAIKVNVANGEKKVQDLKIATGGTRTSK